MNHLSSAQIQAVADNEAPAVERDHAASCPECGAKVARCREQSASLVARLNAIELPPAAARRIEASLQSSGASGATRLRPEARATHWPRAAWGTAGIVAATIAAVVFVAPMLKKDRGAVSAAEILAHSANQLAQPSTGIELLEHGLVLVGAAKAT